MTSFVPKLPEGWGHDVDEVNDDRHFLRHPEGGWITVDFEARSYALGWTYLMRRCDVVFTGRGWQQRLVDAAVKRLDAVMKQ